MWGRVTAIVGLGTWQGSTMAECPQWDTCDGQRSKGLLLKLRLDKRSCQVRVSSWCLKAS